MLRELAAAKNLEFRRRMLGRTLPVVTLSDGALSDNFLKAELGYTARQESIDQREDRISHRCRPARGRWVYCALVHSMPGGSAERAARA